MYLCTGCLMKISLQSLEHILDDILTISIPCIQHFDKVGSLNDFL